MRARRRNSGNDAAMITNETPLLTSSTPPRFNIYGCKPGSRIILPVCITHTHGQNIKIPPKIQKHISNIYITVGYKGAMLAHHVIEKNVSGIFNTEGHGNSWWIFNTPLKYLNEPIVVLTCDNINELDFLRLYEDYAAKGSPACMVVPVVPVQGLAGDYIFHMQ